MTATELVDSFATGFLHTTVHRLPGSGYSWRRSPGPDHPTTLAAPPHSLQSTIKTPAVASVKISWPTPAGTQLHYAVPGAASLARLLWADLPPQLLQRLETILHNTGQLLSHLHHLPLPTALAATPPPGPLRLAHWLDTGQGPRAALRLHHALRETLGDTRWAELRAWCTTLTTTGHPDTALLHGAPSTGTLVLSPTLGEAALLTGEDLATGPASFDAGWLLGEFLELRMTAEHRSAHRPWLHTLAASFLQGYGPVRDTQTMGRAAVLRIATHAHDFASYVGWHDELNLYTATLPQYMDNEGADALTT